jgi:conjugal transfer pilus assembly protein TrbC
VQRSPCRCPSALGSALAGLAALALISPSLGQVPASAGLPTPRDLDEAVRGERARSREVFQRVDNIAPSGRANQERAIPSVNVTPGLGPDPAAIADQFRRMQADATPRGPALLIFVSFAMPPESLLRLAQQAKRADGVLVFRGLSGATLHEMVKRVEPLAKAGAAIEINPEAFARFGVEAVPTFILAEKSVSCGEETCEWRVRRIAGDVTLEYALERLAHADDAIGDAAAERLTSLRGVR